MADRLKILRMRGKDYFIDERLNQIRNVKNPHDFEDVSPELVEFWASSCRMEGKELVCNLDNIPERCPHGWAFRWKDTVGGYGTAGCPFHCVRLKDGTVI